MTGLGGLCAALDGTGIPWSNGPWADPDWPSPPFAVLVAGDSDNLAADGAVWSAAQSYSIQLYAERRDYAAEARVEAALDSCPVPWQKSVVELASEHLVETVYYLPPLREPKE